MRTDLSAFLVSLAAISVACSGSSSPAGSNNGGSSGGGTSSGGPSSSSGGGTGDDGGPGGSSSSSGSGTSSGGSSSGGSSSGSSGSGSSGTDGSTTTASYPSGPYCAAAANQGDGDPAHLKVGCVVPDTAWIGYDDETASALATTEPYAAYSFGTVFSDAQKSGKRYAMLNLAEYDCPGCNKSAVELSTTGDGGVSAGASVVQAGGVVIELLETAGFQNIATQAELEAWVNDPTATGGAHALYVTTVEDPGAAGTASPSLAFFGQREQAYIIDLTTMKVLKYINGDISGLGATSGGLAMTAMHQLLGK